MEAPNRTGDHLQALSAALPVFDAVARSDGGGYSSFHDVDTSAEVDAAFRSQRRIAVAYFGLFIVGLFGVAIVTVSSSWATADRVLGGFSPSFLMTAVGLYLFFVVVGVAAASLANGVDDRMLGADSLPAPGPPGRPVDAVEA